MPVGIGDFCIQDELITKIIHNKDSSNKAYYWGGKFIKWCVTRDIREPLTISEYINHINSPCFIWPMTNNSEENEFLKEAFLYAIKNSYGIDLRK